MPAACAPRATQLGPSTRSKAQTQIQEASQLQSVHGRRNFSLAGVADLMAARLPFHKLNQL
jgi:hypothetical protein